MVLGYAFSVSRGALVFGVEPIGIQTRTAAKKEIFVDFHKLFPPEPILVKDVAGQYIGCNATCQIFDSFPATRQYLPRPIRVEILPYKPALNSGVIAMGFGICFLQQRKPCFILICTMSEVERT